MEKYEQTCINGKIRSMCGVQNVRVHMGRLLKKEYATCEYIILRFSTPTGMSLHLRRFWLSELQYTPVSSVYDGL